MYGILVLSFFFLDFKILEVVRCNLSGDDFFFFDVYE